MKYFKSGKKRRSFNEIPVTCGGVSGLFDVVNCEDNRINIHFDIDTHKIIVQMSPDEIARLMLSLKLGSFDKLTPEESGNLLGLLHKMTSGS